MIWICHAVNHVDNAPAAPAIMRRFNPLALARGKETGGCQKRREMANARIAQQKEPCCTRKFGQMDQ
jgi:hypothetical protein